MSVLSFVCVDVGVDGRGLGRDGFAMREDLLKYTISISMGVWIRVWVGDVWIMELSLESPGIVWN